MVSFVSPGDISTSDNVSVVTGVSWSGLNHIAGDYAFSIWALLSTATTVVQDALLATIEDHTDQNLRSFLAQRLMTGSESGTVNYSVDGASVNRMSVSLVVYRNVGSIGTAVRFTEGGTAVDKHPAANNLSYTPTMDNAMLLLFYSERSSTGNTAGTMTPPVHNGTGTSSTIRRERGTGSSGGAYTCVAEFQLGASTAGVAQTFTQWTATPNTLIASNCDMWIVALYPPLTVSPTGIASAESWGTPGQTSNLPLSPTGITSGEVWGTLAVALSLVVSPGGIPSGEQFGTPGAAPVLTVSPTGIPSGEAFGVPVVALSLTVSPTGIPSAGAFGTPGAALSLTVGPAGIASAEAWGLPAVFSTLQVQPAGIASEEAWGAPAVSLLLAVSPVGIVTGEAWGLPTVTLAPPAVQRDLTLFGVIEIGRFSGVIEAGRWSGTLEQGRWKGAVPWPDQ